MSSTTLQIIDGHILGYWTINEAAKQWDMTPAAIRMRIQRGRIENVLTIKTGDEVNNCFHLIKEGTDKPDDMRKNRKSRR